MNSKRIEHDPLRWYQMRLSVLFLLMLLVAGVMSFAASAMFRKVRAGRSFKKRNRLTLYLRPQCGQPLIRALAVLGSQRICSSVSLKWSKPKKRTPNLPTLYLPTTAAPMATMPAHATWESGTAPISAAIGPAWSDTERPKNYVPLCSDKPGDFRHYAANDTAVINFHLRQIAEAKINFLLLELTPGGLGGYRNPDWIGDLYMVDCRPGGLPADQGLERRPCLEDQVCPGRLHSHQRQRSLGAGHRKDRQGRLCQLLQQPRLWRAGQLLPTQRQAAYGVLRHPLDPIEGRVGRLQGRQDQRKPFHASDVYRLRQRRRVRLALAAAQGNAAEQRGGGWSSRASTSTGPARSSSARTASSTSSAGKKYWTTPNRRSS